ncbi:MAG TPA: hypothetical protein VGP80_13325 [Gemmatimonadales bacterium]|jgi:hypothetical protein|nr:hypothetical protein [Gemmatimonadales bacterium]
MTRFLAGAGLLSLLAGPVSAQMATTSAMPESYRQVQLNALELQRHVLLAMADSMPEQFYRDKVTPIQRDFAQQIEHAAGSMVYIVTSVMKAAPPAHADTAAYLNSKAGLKGFINSTYDWAANVLKTQTPAQREAMATLFGKSMPTWQVWDEIHQHTFWTAGQVVANFRKHGMAPPGFGFF